MKKLKYLAKDHADKHEYDSCVVYEDEMNSFTNGFEVGFKEAFNFIQFHLREERNKLEVFPIMAERKMAMIKMEEKLNQLFEKIVGDEND